MTDAQQRYQEYLRTPRWNVLKHEAVARAGNRCQLCNRRGQLEVHHRTYSRKGQNGEMKDLIALCPECHAKHHGKEESLGSLRVDAFVRAILYTLLLDMAPGQSQFTKAINRYQQETGEEALPAMQQFLETFLNILPGGTLR